jgi:hypothetical protein
LFFVLSILNKCWKIIHCFWNVNSFYKQTYYHIVCMIYVRHKNALYSSIIRFEVKCMHFNQLKFVSLGLQFDLSWLNFFSLWNWHKDWVKSDNITHKSILILNQETEDIFSSDWLLIITGKELCALKIQICMIMNHLNWQFFPSNIKCTLRLLWFLSRTPLVIS